jgi:carbamoyl-phosphate synthase large subunit
MNILVTNIGRKIYFVSFLKDLQKDFKNLNIHLADNDLLSAAVNFDRTINHKIPLVSEGARKYLNSIKKIILNNKINLIIPLTNYDLRILSANKSFFKKYNCEILVSSYKLIEKLLNKKSSYYFCKKNNINVPNSYFNIKDVEKKRKLFMKKHKFGNSSEGIEKIYKVTKNQFKNSNFIQDFIHGKELHFDIFNDFKGNYLSSCVKRKILMRSGETDKAEIIYKKKYEDLAKKISKKFRHIGNLDCDAILNKKGEVFFIDFNPRFGGGYPFTHMAGLNFIKLIINILLKRKMMIPDRPKLIKASKGLVISVCK